MLRRRLMFIKPKEKGGLPDEYEQVEYIRSDGSQYIDLQRKLSNLNDIRIKAIIYDGTGSGFFGCRNSASEKSIQIQIANGITMDFTNSNYANYRLAFSNFDTNSIYEITLSSKIRKIYNTVTETYVQNTNICNDVFETDKNAYLFAINGNTYIGDKKAKAYLYDFKIYKNDILDFDGIPCYRKSDNVAGIYDIVNGVFYSSASGTNFDYPQPLPPIPPTPSDWNIDWNYEMGLPSDNGFIRNIQGTNVIEEMQSDGLYLEAHSANNYINYIPIGYPTNDNTIIEITFIITEFRSSTNGFRVRLSDGSKGVQTYIRSDYLDIAIKNTIATTTVPILINKEYTLRLELLKSESLFRVILDDVMFEKDISDASTQYCNNNAIFIQDNCSVLLKSIKYKFL